MIVDAHHHFWDPARADYPWIAFEGRWGELQPAFFNGPTGPNLKTQWTTSDIAYSRERGLGGPAWEGKPVWKEQSPFWHSKKLKTPILTARWEDYFNWPIEEIRAHFGIEGAPPEGAWDWTYDAVRD